MPNQTTNIQEEIRKAERKLEILRDLDVLDAEFRLIKNEYLQRRQELFNRLKDSQLMIAEDLESA